jgi:hypothetical protein
MLLGSLLLMRAEISAKVQAVFQVRHYALTVLRPCVCALG